MSTKIFLDMDGVLADFVGGICRAHGRPSPYTQLEALGQFDAFEPVWGVSKAEFWATSDSFEFWVELDKTPEADSIVADAIVTVGEENIAILTAPPRTTHAIPGKQTWIAWHYPRFRDRMIFTAAKEFLGAPNRILIDDKDSNIKVFEAEGGRGILVPRLWNSGHAKAAFTANEVGIALKDITRASSRRN